MNRSSLFVLLLATGVALARDVPVATGDDAPKVKGGAAGPATEALQTAKDQAQATAKEDATKEDPNLGMSILGNQEAPKALVIVPWKRSEIGNALGISTMLDDSRLPIDKEVFMRMLSYYEIRSETARHGGAPVDGHDAAPAGKSDSARPTTAAHRRKS